MNFLDPNEWTDLEALEKEHETLTEELIKQLHERLRPYFLRRIKSEVLQLPPKVYFKGFAFLSFDNQCPAERSHCPGVYGSVAERSLPLCSKYDFS